MPGVCFVMPTCVSTTALHLASTSKVSKYGAKNRNDNCGAACTRGTMVGDVGLKAGWLEYAIMKNLGTPLSARVGLQ